MGDFEGEAVVPEQEQGMARRLSSRSANQALVVMPRARKRPPNWPTRLAFCSAAIYLAATVVQLSVQEYHLQRRADFVSRERAELMAQQASIKTGIRMAGTSAGIERLARTQLGLVMAEEIPVKTVGRGDVVAGAPTVVTEPVSKPVAVPPALASLARFFTASWFW